ncbi:MAG TPA: glycine cleavage system protein GcvH [Terriglobia bacterium]|nr:glycine cleavage system protein GcvH [Terriglobia bacterium]
MNPEELLYTKDHEWIRVAGDTGTVGITQHAQEALGDVVYIELPKVGATFSSHQSFGSVESVKAVSELFMPVSGKVTEVNSAIAEAPETLNSDPYGKGWLLRIQIQNAAELSTLLSSKMYEEYVTTQG